LDTVAVQEDLVQQFKAIKPPTRAKQSFEAQVENILKVKAIRLANRPAHSHVSFSSLAFFGFFFAIVILIKSLSIFERGLFLFVLLLISLHFKVVVK